jgi:hypothetical protein
MKHGFTKKSAFILLSILIISILSLTVSAEITTTTPLKSEYNLGDTVTLDGYVVAERDASGTLSTKLSCDNYNLENTATVALREGEKTLLSTHALHQFLLTNDDKTTCKVVITFDGETEESKSFTISNELRGIFTLESKEGDYRLGDEFVLRGTVFKKSGEDVNGDGKVYYSKDGREKELLGEAQINNGKMVYTHRFENLNVGFYSFDVEVTGTTGNTNYLEEVASFRISNDIQLRATALQTTLDPGDEVTINGEIQTNPFSPSEATIHFKVADESYSLVPDSKNFQYKFSLPNDMGPGNYAVLVTISDKYGNNGYANAPIAIRRVPRSLDVTVNKQTFEPGEKLELQINTLDQVGKAMDEEIELEIKDPSNNYLFNDAVFGGQSINVEFGRFTIPGFYTITASHTEQDLLFEETVNVIENKQISADYSDNTLYIKNQGNVPYSIPIDIVLVRRDGSGSGNAITGNAVAGDDDTRYYVIRKEVNLKPQEEAMINLAEEVPEGDYDIYVDDKITDAEGNQITGNAVSDLREASQKEISERVKEIQHSFSEVEVDDDQRSLGKKISQGTSSITGAATYSNKGVFGSSFIGTFFIILVIVALGVLGYHNRDVFERTPTHTQTKRPFKKMKYNEPFSVAGKSTKEERSALVAATRKKKENSLFGKKKKSGYDPLVHANEDGDVHPEVVQAMLKGNGHHKKHEGTIHEKPKDISEPSMKKEAHREQAQKETKNEDASKEQKKPEVHPDHVESLFAEIDKDFLVSGTENAPKKAHKHPKHKKRHTSKADHKPFELDDDI